jgi:hypothetical protein
MYSVSYEAVTIEAPCFMTHVLVGKKPVTRHQLAITIGPSMWTRHPVTLDISPHRRAGRATKNVTGLHAGAVGC